jgi:hypothetical protein
MELYNPHHTKQMGFVRFEVFTAVTMKNAVFWDVAPCISCAWLSLQPPAHPGP